MVKPLKTVVSHEGFLKIVQKQTVEILKICSYLKEQGNKDDVFTKRFYGNLTAQSRILEDFLDDYGAQNNLTWIYLRELMASARYMGFSSYTLNHIITRYALYELEDENKKSFLKQTKTVQHLLNTTIRKIFESVSNEAVVLGLAFPSEKLSEDDFLAVVSDKMLPHNIIEGFSVKEEENVVKIASDYLNILKDYEDLKFDQKYSVDEIEAMIPDSVS